MDRPARLLCWNANGLRGKRPELLLALQEYDVDIALLQETHLRPAEIFTAPNFAVYRTDRPTPGGTYAAGGTAVLVHRRITHAHKHLGGLEAEVTSVTAHLCGREILVSSVYSPPNKTLPETDIDALLSPGTSGLAAGDFNAKHVEWGCRSTNQKGKKLLSHLTTRPQIRLAAPDNPTHYHHDSRILPDILDFMLHTELHLPFKISTITDLSSDHVPLLITLDRHLPTQLQPPLRRRTDWTRYFNYLCDRPRPPPPTATTPGELDDSVADLTACLQDAMLAASTKDSAHGKRLLPDSIMAEVRLKRQLRKTWQRTRFPQDKAAFNRQTGLVQRMLRDHSDGKWQGYLDSLSMEDGSLWRLTKALRAEKPVKRPLQGPGGLVYTPQEKTEVFADAMQRQFSPHEDIKDDSHSDRVTDFLDAMDQADEDEDDIIPQITAAEVTSALARLKPRKAPGLDTIGSAALRKLPPWTIVYITSIFNSCISLSHFPSPWKSAKLILIPKPRKNLIHPENYRPISLLPALSKVLERLILARFPEEFFSSLRQEQYGFRKGHSTTLQLTRVLTSLTDAANLRLHSTAVLVDVSKAFDRVWHEGLLYKIAHSPLPRRMYYLLRSYLSSRTFTVSDGAATSGLRPVSAGVPQGSVLGPVLYLWYTNDMPLAPSVTLSLYADDAMFQAKSMRIRQSTVYMQRQLDLLEPWLKKWRVKVNAAKSEAICFTRKSYGEVMRQSLHLNGEVVPWKDKVRYLGVTLDRRLTLSHHVKTRIDSATAAAWKLAPLTRPSTSLSLTTKLRLYTALLRPSVLYAAPAWYPLTSVSTRRKLEVFQNKQLRKLTGSPWFVRNTCIRDSAGLPTIDEYVTTTSEKLLESGRASSWPHIMRVFMSQGPPEDILRRPIPRLDDPP